MHRSRNTALALCALMLTGGAVAHADSMPGAPHTADATRPAPQGMSVGIRVKADPIKGYNLFLKTWKLTWAPEHAGGRHRRGEGHAHLYVDGVKRTRLYGPAFYLGELTPGRHVIRVTLNANDHADYVRAHRQIADQETVVVPAPTAAG